MKDTHTMTIKNPSLFVADAIVDMMLAGSSVKIYLSKES